MRSTIVIALAALTLAMGCEKKDMSGKKGPSEHGQTQSSPGVGGGPSEDEMSKDAGATSNDPRSGAESLSGGGAKTGAGASGESMDKSADAGK